MRWSGNGDVTAAVSAAELLPGLGNTDTSGCNAADFAGFAAGNIALVLRGSCTIAVKATNARTAGASDALISSPGNADPVDRLGLLFGSLGEAFTLDMPAMGLPYALGVELAGTPGLTMRMEVDLDDPIRPVPVPAPASLPLLGIGLAALAIAHRRRG